MGNVPRKIWDATGLRSLLRSEDFHRERVIQHTARLIPHVSPKQPEREASKQCLRRRTKGHEQTAFLGGGPIPGPSIVGAAPNAVCRLRNDRIV